MVVPIYVSTVGVAVSARSVVGEAYVSTAGYAQDVRTVNACHAQLKDAPSLATVFVLLHRC